MLYHNSFCASSIYCVVGTLRSVKLEFANFSEQTLVMKKLLSLLALNIVTLATAQEVKPTEQSVPFSSGSHNAIVVTIPHAMKDIVEKELRSELKDWGGKYNNSKGEMTATQASFKAMGDKYFDAIGKVIETGNNEIMIAIAVDLGGAFLDSKQHNSQYKVIEERIRKMALRAAIASIDEDLAAQGKVLRTMEKDKKDLEGNIEDSKKAIEDYKKRIADAEQKIKDNEAAVLKKDGEIKDQTGKIGEIEKKKKGVK